MSGCLALSGLALFACVARDPACLPPAHKEMLPFIASTVDQESRFNPYAVRNEAEGRGHYFRTQAEAVEYAVAQDKLGIVLGLGWGQHTHRSNWRLHTGAEGRDAITQLLDPCKNMQATARHYAAAWGASIAYNAGPGRIGSPPAQSAAYAKRVISGAAEMRQALSAASASPSAAEPAAAPEPPPPTTLTYGRTAAGRTLTYGQR